MALLIAFAGCVITIIIMIMILTMTRAVVYFCTQLTATNALPATPEVNEEHSSGRSTSPETKPQTTDTAGIYNYGQSYSAYYPTKFETKKRSLSKNNEVFVKTKRRKPKQSCCLFRLSGRFSRSRSGAYRVRNDSLPYFVRSSSVRPVGFNKISPPLSHCSIKSVKKQRPPPSPQQQPRHIDVTKGRIRLNLYAYPKGYLKFLESYFVCNEHRARDDIAESTRKRLSAISEEDVCPLCGGSIDYANLVPGRWKNALLVPFWV